MKKNKKLMLYNLKKLLKKLTMNLINLHKLPNNINQVCKMLITLDLVQEVLKEITIIEIIQDRTSKKKRKKKAINTYHQHLPIKTDMEITTNKIYFKIKIKKIFLQFPAIDKEYKDPIAHKTLIMHINKTIIEESMEEVHQIGKIIKIYLIWTIDHL